MTASISGNQSSLKGAMALARTPAASLIGPLRRLRSLVQDLDALCDEVQRGDATLAERADALRKQADEAAGIVNSLATDGDNADVFQDVKNSWDHLANNPVIKSPLVALAPEVLLRHLKQVEVASETLVCQVGRITIPARINDWLAAMRPGNRISFHQRFEDEIPSLTRRKALLADFASTPRLLPQGLIRRHLVRDAGGIGEA